LVELLGTNGYVRRDDEHGKCQPEAASRRMTYLLAGLVTIWLCGLLFLAGQQLNDGRVVLNNLAPDAQSSEVRAPPPQRLLYMTASTFPFVPTYPGLTFLAAMLLLGRLFNFNPTKAYGLAHFDPALLKEAGRDHLKKVSRHQLIIPAWTIAGVILIVWMSSGNP
jgi:hypothetical protein